MAIRGSCLCGSVNYQIDGPLREATSCHCSMCRKAHGAAFGTYAGLDPDRFRWLSGEAYVSIYNSSPDGGRCFCSKCGSNLFYYLKGADRYVMWMGTFEDQAPFHVAGEIYIDDKPAGYDIAGDHPRLTGEEFMASMLQGSE